MVKIVPTPDWFLGKDILIEAFSVIVLIIFSFLSIKNYKLDKEKRSFLYLGIGFGLIALAQLAGVLTRLVLYYDFGPSQQIGSAIVASQALSSVDIFYYAGFFFQRFLTLAGIYIIYRLPREKKSMWDYVIGAYFIVISLLLINEVAYLFHLTALFILVMITTKYYNVYEKNKFFNTKILVLAFGVLAFSQILFLFSEIGVLHVAGNIVELISYVVLLGLIIRIRKYGKKKKSYGNNLRHAGDNPGKKRKH